MRFGIAGFSMLLIPERKRIGTRFILRMGIVTLLMYITVLSQDCITVWLQLLGTAFQRVSFGIRMSIFYTILLCTPARTADGAFSSFIARWMAV